MNGFSAFYRGGARHLQRAVAVADNADGTSQHAIGVIPFHCRVAGIRYYGQVDVDGDALTAEVYARALNGGVGVSLQSAATDVAFASQTAARAGVAAGLTATTEHLYLKAGQLLEVEVVADSLSQGPGEILVVVEVVPVAT